MKRGNSLLFAWIATPTMLTGVAHAQVPADIAVNLKEMGRVVNPAGTAVLYRPLQPRQPYTGVKVARDLSYGPDARNILDVFTSEQASATPRTVLIYVSGGTGNKIEPVANGDAFYDNIMLWAVKNDMVGVNVQSGGQGFEPGRVIGAAVDWVRENISRFNGNPQRVFIWAHSAGNGPVGAYIGQPDFQGPKGVGLKGAIFMSGAPATGNGRTGGFGSATGRGAFSFGNRAPDLPGRAAGDIVVDTGKGLILADNAKSSAPPPGTTAPPPTNLEGILKLDLPIYLAAAELDPQTTIASNDILKNQLCSVGRCPTLAVFKDHSHMSEVFAPNTEDDSVTGPILRWIKSIIAMGERAQFQRAPEALGARPIHP